MTMNSDTYSQSERQELSKYTTRQNIRATYINVYHSTNKRKKSFMDHTIFYSIITVNVSDIGMPFMQQFLK